MFFEWCLQGEKPVFHRQFFFGEDYLPQNLDFGNEFAITHSKDYVYYLARLPLSQIFDIETSLWNLTYTSIFFYDKPTSVVCFFTEQMQRSVEPSHRNTVGGKACSSTKGGLLRFSTPDAASYVAPKYSTMGGYPVTLLPPPRSLIPRFGMRTTWVRQFRSGSCHYRTAATKCNEQPSQATETPSVEKTCSPTKQLQLSHHCNQM